MGTLVTLVIFGGCALVAICFSPVGGAIAARIRGRGVPGEVPAALLTELDELRGRMEELEERADFAERALSRSPDAPGTSSGARS